MNRALTATLAVILLLTSSMALADREVEDYSKTINMFKENATVASYFSSAHGYAVFPTIGKGGLGIGAARGKGQVYRGGQVTGFATYTDVSIGFQAGGQAYSQVVFFENEAAYADFTSGNFEFDAGASAIAITASAEQMVKEVERTGVLKISREGNVHPIFTPLQNLKLRAVHDYIVHILGKSDFSRRGEIRAYNLHRRLAPRDSWPALFTEVAAQACFVNTFGHFPEQKIAVLDGVDFYRVGNIEGVEVKGRKLQSPRRYPERELHPPVRANPDAPPWARKAADKLDYSGVDDDWVPLETTDAIGCGHYGCVYALPADDVVLKFTSDPTEINFIKKAMELDEWPDGIVKYFALREVGMTYRKRPVFAIWRESAFDVGLYAAAPTKDMTPFEREEARALQVLGTRLGQFQHHAGLIKRHVDAMTKKKGVAGRREYLEKAFALEDWAWRYVSDEVAFGRASPGGYGPRSYPRITSLKGPQRIAAALRACEIVAMHMTNERKADLIGSALDFYLDNGLLLADVHLNNIGQVRRTDEYGTSEPWVITDPGHAVDLRA